MVCDSSWTSWACQHLTRVTCEFSGDVAKARLWLVDLAGSERLSRSEAVGERLAEAQVHNFRVSSCLGKKSLWQTSLARQQRPSAAVLCLGLCGPCV